MKRLLTASTRAPFLRLAVAVVIALLRGSQALAGNPSNPILFVTQVPMPEEVNTRTISTSYMSCVSPFGNHLADTASTGRGGSLYVRFSDGQIFNLLAVSDWSAVPGGQPPLDAIAVRNPAVSWTADRAIFSMVVGKPSAPSDTTTFFWRLYEITLPTQAQLNAGAHPVLTLVPNQPAYNNVFPAYALGGRIVFASDRPYNGQAHLTQREEYLGLPTVTGLYSLDPSSAASLQLLHHAPSGAFSPSVDSAGRLVFTNWDHMARDPEAVTDSRPPRTGAPYNETFTQTFNGSGNFADESAGAAFTPVTSMPPESWDIFPEPRNFDRKTLIDVYGDLINGNAINVFLPWTVNLDGTGVEVLNHVGRHEVAGAFTRSFKNDPNIVDLNPGVNPGYGGMTVRTYFGNFLWPREDPLSPGTYFGSDAPDLGTHGAGQIVKLNNAGIASGNPMNPDGITVTYVTPGANGAAKPAFIPNVRPSINLPPTGQAPLSPANAETLYRTPVPLADGNLVASWVGGVTQTDYNAGSANALSSLYAFRLRSLRLSGGTWVPDVTLTPGFTINTSYYVGATLVSYNGPAWELDPAEVVARTPPTALTSSMDPIEAGVFASVGVDVPTFQSYLRAHGAALSVSRNVTRRDRHDRQQPFNLKVGWSSTQTTATAGTLYDVSWVQFLQGDLRRGYTQGAPAPAPGRRVVATPLHDTWSENVTTPGAPPGALRLGDDGSFAAILPAHKAMTWHLLANNAAKTSQVKERFWVTFADGEIRTCTNCHGINTSDQAGQPAPTNPPQALVGLLQYWKGNHPPGAMQHASSSVSAWKTSSTVSLPITRTGGSTGPVSVQLTTADGTAHAGVDYAATTTAVSWADGDTTPKTVDVSILGGGGVGARTFTATLSNPQFGTIGAMSTVSVTLNDAGPMEAAPPGSAPLLVTKGAGTALGITYAAACHATSYAVYAGTGPIAGSLAWTRSFCSVGSSFDPGTAAAGSLLYFVVVGENAAFEGSYGRGSSGLERPEATGVGACDKPQLLAGSCP